MATKYFLFIPIQRLQQVEELNVIFQTLCVVGEDEAALICLYNYEEFMKVMHWAYGLLKFTQAYNLVRFDEF